MSFLAFVLDNSGCIKRIRWIWLSIFPVIFLIQFVYQESFDGKLLLFIDISVDVMQMFDLYIMYLFIKVNHITFKECRVSIIYMLYYNLQGKYDFINI